MIWRPTAQKLKASRAAKGARLVMAERMASQYIARAQVIPEWIEREQLDMAEECAELDELIAERGRQS